MAHMGLLPFDYAVCLKKIMVTFPQFWLSCRSADLKRDIVGREETEKVVFSMRALFKKNVVLWLAMLCGVLLDLALMGVGLLWYPSLLEAGRASTAMTCVVMLLVYGCVGIGLPIKASQAVMAALWQGTAVGLIIGVIFAVDMSVEDFIDLGRQASLFSTLGFMLLIFLLFGLAGARGTQKTRHIPLGILGSLWSAMIGVLIALLFGFAVNFLFTQRLEHILSSDYVSSGMSDPQAFTFFHSLESASSHLMEAPLIAAVCGTIGALTMQGLISLRGRGFLFVRPRS